MSRKITVILIFVVGFWSLNTHRAGYGELRIEIANINAPQGTIWIGVYASEKDFLNREHGRLLSVPVRQTRSLRARIEDLRTDRYYAIALFHDRNNNGELDRSFLGVPTEPFAFSGRLQSRWRLPRFTEVRFRLEPEHPPMRFYLRNWSGGL